MSSGKDITYANDVKYADSHEWIRLEGEFGVVGITDYAQDALGDVVFVELPAVGSTFDQGKTFGVVESVKAASDIYLPASGTITAINEKLIESPEMLNQDAFGEAWLVKLKLSNPAELEKLMDAESYKKKIDSGELH
jgi:glycine cleavage system H protein